MGLCGSSRATPSGLGQLEGGGGGYKHVAPLDLGTGRVPMRYRQPSNMPAPVDAPVPSLPPIARHWRRATDQQRWFRFV